MTYNSGFLSLPPLTFQTWVCEHRQVSLSEAHSLVSLSVACRPACRVCFLLCACPSSHHLHASLAPPGVSLFSTAPDASSFFLPMLCLSFRDLTCVFLSTDLVLARVSYLSPLYYFLWVFVSPPFLEDVSHSEGPRGAFHHWGPCCLCGHHPVFLFCIYQSIFILLLSKSESWHPAFSDFFLFLYLTG